jgi:hypothetical protein
MGGLGSVAWAAGAEDVGDGEVGGDVGETGTDGGGDAVGVGVSPEQATSMTASQGKRVGRITPSTSRAAGLLAADDSTHRAQVLGQAGRIVSAETRAA